MAVLIDKRFEKEMHFCQTDRSKGNFGLIAILLCILERASKREFEFQSKFFPICSFKVNHFHTTFKSFYDVPLEIHLQILFYDLPRKQNIASR